MDKLIIDVRVNEHTMRDANPHVPCMAGKPARDAAGRMAPGFASVNLGSIDIRDPGAEACTSTDKTCVDTTGTLVRRVVELAHACGREVATPEDARRMPGITR